ncbi:hypothetical protein JKP88DRAFT_243855 [Tribonema minus]|uniref:Uncharacterized protein n=1 Tax=Tribonema minus TaxID=303371 RepID=A0A835Z503_9STRA|nr:hypothetical protein JKP88DRAFT_243855 [Tribonema minus]
MEVTKTYDAVKMEERLRIALKGCGGATEVVYSEGHMDQDEIAFYEKVRRTGKTDRLLLPSYCGLRPIPATLMCEEMRKRCEAHQSFVLEHRDAHYFYTADIIKTMCKAVKLNPGTVMAKITMTQCKECTVKEAMEAIASQELRNTMWSQVLQCIKDFASLGGFHCGETLLLDHFVLSNGRVYMDVGTTCFDLSNFAYAPTPHEVYEFHVQVMMPQVQEFVSAECLQGLLQPGSEQKFKQMQELLPTLTPLGLTDMCR